MVLKLESLSAQNADPTLWQIVDPYIGLAQFCPLRKLKAIHCCPFIDFLANSWTYLVIDLKKVENCLHFDAKPGIFFRAKC